MVTEGDLASKFETGLEVAAPDPVQLSMLDNPWLTKLREAPVDEGWLAKANDIIPTASKDLTTVADPIVVASVDTAREDFYGELLGMDAPWRKLYKAYQTLRSSKARHLPMPSTFIGAQRALHDEGINVAKALKNNSYTFRVTLAPLERLFTAIKDEEMLPRELITANASLINVTGISFKERINNADRQGFQRKLFVRSDLISLPTKTLNGRIRRAGRFAGALGGREFKASTSIARTFLSVSDEKTFFHARVLAEYGRQDMEDSEVNTLISEPVLAHMATLALKKPYSLSNVYEIQKSLPIEVMQTIVDGFTEQRLAERKEKAKEAGFFDNSGEGDDSKLPAEPIDKIIRAYLRYIEAKAKRQKTKVV